MKRVLAISTDFKVQNKLCQGKAAQWRASATCIQHSWQHTLAATLAASIFLCGMHGSCRGTRGAGRRVSWPCRRKQVQDAWQVTGTCQDPSTRPAQPTSQPTLHAEGSRYCKGQRGCRACIILEARQRVAGAA